MKNTFKKQDSKGNKLPEEIGKGLNKTFCKKVLEQRTKSDTLRIRCTPFEKERLLNYCEAKGINMSDLFRPTLEKIVKIKTY